MELRLDYNELENVTGFRNLKYNSPKSVTQKTGLFRKKIKIVRVEKNKLTVDFGLFYNLLMNKQMIGKWSFKAVEIKLEEMESLILDDIEFDKTGVKIKGKI